MAIWNVVWGKGVKATRGVSAFLRGEKEEGGLIWN